MILSSSLIKQDAVIEADICVIGCGAAGITLGLEFAGSPLRICILESGGLQAQGDHDPLYAIESSNLPVSNASRMRAVGGTTKVWAGRWKEHDPIDFTVRDWVPFSGWPVGLETLRPFYTRAAALLRIPTQTNTASHLLQSGTMEQVEFLSQQPSLRDWGRTFGPTLKHASNITLYTDSHVLRMQRDGKRVRGLRCARSDGSQFSVQATSFVLATGGIENARQLLLSEIGNEHDQVGRYYMDHPKGKLGVIETYHPVDLSAFWDFDMKGGTSYTGLRLSDDLQQEQCVLNSSVLLEPLHPRSFVSRMLRKLHGGKRSAVVAIRNYLEQAPSPDNRVRLSASKDPLGLPRAMVDWRLSDIDCRTMQVFHRTLRTELQRAGIGEVRSPLLLDPSQTFPITTDASHHMGTTRMGTDPTSSVVDVDCRVHGCDNLFVAGSSVFPTGGYANPMATLCALALRLADLLKTL